LATGLPSDVPFVASSWITLIDKGELVAFKSPEVRALASWMTVGIWRQVAASTGGMVG